MRIENGRWVMPSGEGITVMDGKNFSDIVGKVKAFSDGKSLSYNKIEILCNILETDDDKDYAMTKVMGMSSADIRRLWR